MIELQLRAEEAKLAYLAIAYHLGRPGSELDPITKQPLEHGLAEVARDLQPQMRMAVVRIALDDTQLSKFLSGMLGSITELKAYSMLEPHQPGAGTSHRSTVRGFDTSLRHLFPEVEEDPESALDIAEQMLMFKRRLDSRLAAMPKEEPPPPPPKRGWWPFGRR